MLKKRTVSRCVNVWARSDMSPSKKLGLLRGLLPCGSSFALYSADVVDRPAEGGGRRSGLPMGRPRALRDAGSAVGSRAGFRF